MGLIRLITFALLIWILWFMYRNYVAGKSPKTPPGIKAGKVVKCSYCQVHLPQQEAVQDDSGWFCSHEHKKAHLDKN